MICVKRSNYVIFFILLPILMGSDSLQGEDSVLVEVDLSLKGLCHPGKQTGSHKRFFWKMITKY